MTMLRKQVALYRRLKPNVTFSTGVFTYSNNSGSHITYSTIYSELSSIKECIRELDLKDGDSYEYGQNPLPQYSDHIVSYLEIATGSSEETECKFIERFDILLEAFKNKQYQLPRDFYLVEEDYLHSDREIHSNPKIESISILNKFVYHLDELAQHKDPCNGIASLIFTSDANLSKPVVIDIIYDEDLLNITEFSYDLLISLTNQGAENDMHYQEKRIIFNSSLNEFLINIDQKNALKKIILDWIGFTDLYKKNLEIYLSGFTFHKAKQHIVDEEVKMARNISSVFTEISGKLLAIPLSLAALVTIKQDNTWAVNFNIFLGIVLVSLITFLMIFVQNQRFSMIKQDRKFISDSLSKNKEMYPENIQNHLRDSNKRLSNSECCITVLIYFFMLIVWVPAILAWHIW